MYILLSSYIHYCNIFNLLLYVCNITIYCILYYSTYTIINIIFKVALLYMIYIYIYIYIYLYIFQRI